MTLGQVFWLGVWPLIVAGILLLADHWQARMR
jgi:hypothetical protein